MSEVLSLHHLSFASPRYLLALLVVPLLVAFAVAVRKRRSRYTVSYTNLALLAAIVARRGTRWRRRLPLILIALALAAFAAALARPQVQVQATDRSATVVLLADVSDSMRATDLHRYLANPPTRLEETITALHDFLAVLPATDEVGLVTFSDNVEVLNTPTRDRQALESGIRVLKPQGGTALGDGVRAAVRLAVTTLATNGVYHTPGKYLPAAVVLESDGHQNRGSISPLAAAQLARATGIRIYGVALGERNTYMTQGHGLFKVKIPVPPDRATIALLARETGGQAFNATDSDQLNSIYRQLGSRIGRHNEPREITSWFELAGAVLLVAGVAVARLRGGALP